MSLAWDVIWRRLTLSIVACCRGVVLDETTEPADLKHFLVSRLSRHRPRLGASVLLLDDHEMEGLRQEILNALRVARTASRGPGRRRGTTSR